MSKTLWGKVYYFDTFAGRLDERPGNRYEFTYDESYLNSNQPPIAYTLPLSPKPYISENGLHPFFDNLVAEGWAKKAQARALGVNPNNHFALLLGFGNDLAGGVSIIDPEPEKHHLSGSIDEATLAVLRGRASLSGIQRKLLVVKEGKQYRPAGPNELSTFIAKLSSGNLNELLELEYLTTQVIRTLLPDDNIVTIELTHLPSIKEDALIIPRFDRTPTGKRLYHFEEFNQLLGRLSGDDKYDGDYEEMGQFILNTPGCLVAESYRLLKRILAYLLVGNTDAHFKNFAMFHTREGLRLTPAYDLVASSIYREFQTIALNIGSSKNLLIGSLKPKHFLKMAKGFGVGDEALIAAIEDLKKQFSQALTLIEKSSIGSRKLQKQLQQKMEKRWNGSFNLTGKPLSARPSKGDKNKN